MSKKEMFEKLKEIGFEIAKLYGSNIKIELDCNSEMKSVKLKITEHIK